MAYSELIKDFGRIRSYLRSFYVYGFQHRDDFTQKSARSYDNERRRIESWLGKYLSFRQDENGRRIFLSVDSRQVPENPLYRAFKTKSFTSWDIALHFYLLAILQEAGKAGSLSITGIMDRLMDMLCGLADEEYPDESTVRKKLKEYAGLGLIVQKKQGRETHYAIPEECFSLESWQEALAFFTEAVPLGVIGSFLQDRLRERSDFFRFKHHYILNALDSEIVFEALRAIHEKRFVTLTAGERALNGRPLRLYTGTQTGRQYLLIESRKRQRLFFQRIDLIENITAEDPCPEDPDLEDRLAFFTSRVWGVSGGNADILHHLEMVVAVGPDEYFIVKRLLREKRSGTVEKIDDTHWRFSADVYNPMEMMPWIRSFTGRITELKCSLPWVVTRFSRDFATLARMYGVDRNYDV